MRSWFALTMLAMIAACPPKSAPEEPTPPRVPDAAVDADPGPMQTPPENTVILATAYPQHCTHDGECVAVFEGDACNPCRCAFNAIRVDAFAKYKADLGAFWSCHKAEDCKIACSQAIGDAATCQAGTCLLLPP